MNILQEKCLTKEWLADQWERMRRADPGLLEKSIHALELVGHLTRSKLPFVFKGGSCMLLLLDEVRRLSIDVDIVCTVPRPELESVLRTIGGESRFEKFESDYRDPDRLPKRSHYKFSYTSAVNGKSADKLTAFAPGTIGVQYSAYGASLKILKHCADVGVLFDRCSNLDGLFGKTPSLVLPASLLTSCFPHC